MHFLNEKRKCSSCPKEIQFFNDNPQEKTDIRKIDAPPASRELKKRWSYFIRKVYETECKREYKGSGVRFLVLP